jgi:rare lipoprotein A
MTNIENGKKVEIRINEIEPFADNRALDLSSTAANKLDMKEDGTAQVSIETKSIKKRDSNNLAARKNKTKKPHH